ncbi:MAG: hypothetical protein MZU97_22235 [Bacillus subtilis]|nr:hypothetical protein [Bacillus subtilis]
MDELGRKVSFPYATLFVAAAFVTMFLVRHGDAKIIDQKLPSSKISMSTWINSTQLKQAIPKISGSLFNWFDFETIQGCL